MGVVMFSYIFASPALVLMTAEGWVYLAIASLGHAATFAYVKTVYGVNLPVYYKRHHTQRTKSDHDPKMVKIELRDEGSAE